VSPLKTCAVLLVVALGASATSQYSSGSVVERVYADAGYQQAVASFERDHARFVGDVVHITEIPAPPFGEAARAEAVAGLFRATHPTSVDIDEAGNVLALRRGATGGQSPLVVLAAHLDTVFPAGTKVVVRRDGSRLSAPGVGDNAQGVAFLVALSRALDVAAVTTSSDLLLVADVGEEGDGDLHGMKQLFGSRLKDRIRAFVAVDGTGDGGVITTGAVGSRRYRVTFHGPGGHSFGAFGLVSPVHAVAAAIDKLAAIRPPSSPRTTYNVGAIGGGTAVNAIPHSAWMDVDLRSEGEAELQALDRAFRTAIAEATDAENRSRSIQQGRVTADIALTGSRPLGRTPANSRLVSTAAAVWRKLGISFVYGSASSDANWPMSLGIPAIAVDTGLPGGRPHALDEWVDVDSRYASAGFRRLLLLAMSLAGT
jgi:acetylornithine deacetylase/succinyl-diaminopimelate desuccinylase-like protein